MRNATRLILLVLGLISFGFVVSKVQAHGFGKQELMQVEAGPYVLSAWVDPRNITTDDKVHVSVSVQWQDDLYRNANVQVVFKHRDDATKTITQQATPDTNGLFYETEFHPAEVGKYDVTVIVDSDEAGHGEATFDMDVEAGKKTGVAALVDNDNVRWGLAGFAVILLGILYWIFDKHA
jgi:hypothetical protein